jgi:hypothetical protein
LLVDARSRAVAADPDVPCAGAGALAVVVLIAAQTLVTLGAATAVLSAAAVRSGSRRPEPVTGRCVEERVVASVQAFLHTARKREWMESEIAR